MINLWISIVKDKTAEIKFFARSNIPIFIDGAFLAFFVVLQNLSLYAIILYFCAEAFIKSGAAEIAASDGKISAEEKSAIKSFFENNQWYNTISSAVLCVITLAVFVTYNGADYILNNTLAEIKWPFVYLLIFTASMFIPSKTRVEVVVRSMTSCVSSLLPSFLITLFIVETKLLSDPRNIWLGLIFVVTKTIINILTYQTIEKKYIKEKPLS